MELRNADGGRAETSGNGLRCLALAAVDAGLAPSPELAIETDAGVRRAVLTHRDGAGSAYVSVEMGRLRVVPLPGVSDALLPGSTAEPWPSWSVDAGNPHLVVLAPSLEDVPIGAIGPILERRRPGGQNVEIVVSERGSAADELTLLVWERGVGVTLACGSGSAAAAAALHCRGDLPGPSPGAQSGRDGRGDAHGGRSIRPSRRSRRPGSTRRPHRARSDGPRCARGARGRIVRSVNTTLIDRRFREKIVLVGMVAWPRTVEEVEASLDELALLVDTAGADEAARVLQRREAPDAGDLHRPRQGGGAAPHQRSGGRRHRGLRRRADARSAAQPREDPREDGHRQDGGDPGHLRPERPHTRRPRPGRARSEPLPPPAPAGQGRDAVPTGRPDRDTGTRRDPARGRPAADHAAHPQARSRASRSRSDPQDSAART